MIPTAEISQRFPTGSKVVVILSGGMDSTIITAVAAEQYGAENVFALTFFYGQKQSIEIEKARITTDNLNLGGHLVVDMSFFGEMVKGISANVGGGLDMPTIKDILGDPTPPTYVPNRNMVMLSIAASYAETVDASLIFTGLQAQDEYSYFDTTPAFISAMNSALGLMRTRKVQIAAPFQGINKANEILFLKEIKGNIDLLENTMTCYNPNGDISCGKCPSCAERIQAFMKAGEIDPVPYAIDIPWPTT